LKNRITFGFSGRGRIRGLPPLSLFVRESELKPYVKVILAAIVLTGCDECPGGIKPSYQPQDYDPKLTDFAKIALPIINAADQFRKEKGRLPTYDELLVMLPENEKPSNKDGPQRWHYFINDKDYLIAIKLGWDSCLKYTSKDRVWSFDPGDGGMHEVPVKLDPYTK